MKGIAIIIPNADFSGSPLGKVTKSMSIEEKAQEIVSSYSTEVGVSDYNVALKSMIVSLMDKGIWEGLDVYPIIGDTVTKMCKNINTDNGYLKKDLLVPSSTSVEDNSLLFNNVSSTAQELPNVDKRTIASSTMSGYYCAFDVVATEFSDNMYIIYGGRSGSFNIRITTSKSVAADAANKVIDKINTADTRRLYSLHSGDSNFDIYVNGTLGASASNFINWNGTKQNLVIPCGIGNTLKGNVRLFVQGFIPQDKHVEADKIFRKFLDATKL